MSGARGRNYVGFIGGPPGHKKFRMGPPSPLVLAPQPYECECGYVAMDWVVLLAHLEAARR